MQTITICNLDDIFPLLKISKFSLFRGLSNNSYRLTTSLARNGGDELAILRNFAKYAALEDASIWEQMIRGQHHGLPTRLLDWSHSPLVALYFAINEDNLEDIYKNDCAVWQIDVDELNSFLPKKYNAMLYDDELFFTLHKLKEKRIKLEDIDTDKAIILLEPPAIDTRIINQFSYFSVVPRSIDMETFLECNKKTVKYIISKEIRLEIRNMLIRLNVCERTLFPGFDGTAKQIGKFFQKL